MKFLSFLSISPLSFNYKIGKNVKKWDSNSLQMHEFKKAVLPCFYRVILETKKHLGKKKDYKRIDLQVMTVSLFFPDNSCSSHGSEKLIHVTGMLELDKKIENKS